MQSTDISSVYGGRDDGLVALFQLQPIVIQKIDAHGSLSPPQEYLAIFEYEDDKGFTKLLKYGGARYHSLVSDTVAQIDVPTLRAHDVIVARHVNDKMPHKAVSRLAQVNAHLGNFAPQSQKDNGEVYAAALSSPIIPHAITAASHGGGGGGVGNNNNPGGVPGGPPAPPGPIMGPLDVTAWYNGQNYWFQSSWGQAFRQQDGTDAPVIWSEEASVDGHFVPINIVQIPIREGGPLSGALMRMGASRKWVLAMGPAVSQSG